MRRPNAQMTVVLCACTALLALPAIGHAAGSGGSGGGGSGGAGFQSGSSPSASGAHGSVSSSANGMTISTRPAAFLSGQLVMRGDAPSGDAGDAVELERHGQQPGGAWVPTARGNVQPSGSFELAWRTDHVGRFELRAVLEGSRGADAAAEWPTVTVTIYQTATATIYGPGFYGHRTACGEILRRQTVGVANRTLRCGTEISIYYRGKTISAPVIDRGPYSNHASWDLTEATARALGMKGTATIGAASIPRSG